MGDGVAERSKASIGMRAVAGSRTSVLGGTSLRDSHGIWRERPPSSTPSIPIPTGAQIEILPIKHPNYRPSGLLRII
ncbi:hypothetical protein FWK35_00012828 [Aphis craccivora]|uniref:Uncharacterized protein n=1 Tax=Aphis craccivora TaxID=307492 RepID=A0A6G0ZPP7_APHCR|nr:hypothetical protein FWK35_00012828 [Aphis craccivora]